MNARSQNAVLNAWMHAYTVNPNKTIRDAHNISGFKVAIQRELARRSHVDAFRHAIMQTFGGTHVASHR